MADTLTRPQDALMDPFPNQDLAAAALVERALTRGEARLAAGGALAADTGRFTGRSPADRFIVQDEIGRAHV